MNVPRSCFFSCNYRRRFKKVLVNESKNQVFFLIQFMFDSFMDNAIVAYHSTGTTIIEKQLIREECDCSLRMSSRINDQERVASNFNFSHLTNQMCKLLVFSSNE